MVVLACVPQQFIFPYPEESNATQVCGQLGAPHVWNVLAVFCTRRPTAHAERPRRASRHGLSPPSIEAHRCNTNKPFRLPA